MNTYESAVPAYGRDYPSQAALRADWIKGRDFRLEPSSQYFSIRDVEALRAEGVKVINFRYNKLRSVLPINL